jgi:hypothetical protein
MKVTSSAISVMSADAIFADAVLVVDAARAGSQWARDADSKTTCKGKMVAQLL